MSKKKRKKKLAVVEEPQPVAEEVQAPVVTVTCPNCGASVAADPGERTECRYCGTDLHLPRLEYEAEKPSEPPPSEEPEPPRRKLVPVRTRELPGGVVAAVVLAAFLVLGVSFYLIVRPGPIASDDSIPATPGPTPDPTSTAHSTTPVA